MGRASSAAAYAKMLAISTARKKAQMVKSAARYAKLIVKAVGRKSAAAVRKAS